MKPTSDHSFPDAKVTAWQLSESLLEVEVSDVFFAGSLRGPAKITFPLVQSATVMAYDHSSSRWSEGKKEALKDICEFHFKNESHYSLKGFGAESGRWLAVGILSRDAQITW